MSDDKKIQRPEPQVERDPVVTETPTDSEKYHEIVKKHPIEAIFCTMQEKKKSKIEPVKKDPSPLDPEIVARAKKAVKTEW